ncbi:hypothetical protein [Micromonospora sp. CB01531]|uniref:hypothetical protein n=1 Tax=Micromonospora sp. CB01531 TaxID=1718947 RepID=UPI0009635670|nr:hypothetical protein [Micromonospora sp. CB01531]OKI60671.1 hypothetical protein A6A27_29240 [Micromonospora sp. CB01531]
MAPPRGRRLSFFTGTSQFGDPTEVICAAVVVIGANAPREPILGIRPEHFEDAELVDEQTRCRGMEFEVPVEIVESMGSDKYV